MKKVFSWIWWFGIFPAGLLPCAAFSSSPQTVSAYFENDTFYGTDRDYTNGIRFTYTAAHVPFASGATTEKVHRLIDRIPVIGHGDSQRLFALSLGQNIYTADDTYSREYLPDERPYAGLSYLGFALLKRKDCHLSTWELGLGLVGKDSYAEDTQRVIHDWGGWSQPSGWEHQLRNEPVLQIFYTSHWRFASPQTRQGLGMDVLPRAGWGIGNGFTSLGGGMEVRAGWNLPRDFGNGHIRPATETHLPLSSEDPRFNPPFRRVGVHLYGGASGSWVARNILLDGNTFRSSASVDKEMWVGNYSYGIGVILYRFKIVYGRVHSSREYKTQKEGQSYGTVHVSYTW
ncbi:lipid A deacylase LpxR family protein [Desulfobotulus sp. H1]|uniref:Lipid A deacylase LpxR family protein n=1 Tax=Desulfobotulus pelophilus TaxID=2823377 RepID=A0ABT3NCT3_9BACT|nr:lipid A deacylase LpxR family protein [Desulfobotulus pelophilus]MCW7754772.1 lipid A deacylase LpxR family protein [Desulfobotulus pelophilus]